MRHMLLGLLSGICESIAKATIQFAVTHGPSGPATAISSISSVFLAIFEHIINERKMNLIEILALFLCMFGIMAVAIPNQYVIRIMRGCSCCCCEHYHIGSASDDVVLMSIKSLETDPQRSEKQRRESFRKRDRASFKHNEFESFRRERLSFRKERQTFQFS